jgi:hypothetical protein
MTVINPSSISGITSITMPSGDGNVLTIHTNDGVERFRIDSSGNVKVGSACTISQDGDVFFTGVCTATTLAGSGANLTALPAGNLTGALPAISGANLTGIAATDNVRTGILDVAGVSTFRNTMNVGAAVTISESGLEATGVGITVANINGGKVSGRRNIWINGAMNIAQRGTSSTSTGYTTVDRWVVNNNAGTITKAQLDLSASDTGPWESGMRHALRLTNTSAIGSGAGDYAECYYRPEAQDLATSGWEYTSGNSFITLSYWARASVAQAYPATIKMGDWDYFFPWNYTIAQANVWQKFVIKIHGHSSMTINNDNGIGFTMWINAYQGSNYFSGSYTANDWNAESGSYMFAGSPTTTWGTTTGATWDITGFQLEVGSQATAFEHLTHAEELRLCQRYCQKFDGLKINARMNGSTNSDGYWQFPTMRATPSFSSDVSSGKSMEYGSIGRTVANVYGGGSSPESAYSRFNISGSGTSGHASYNNLSTGSYYLLESEL